MFQEAGKIPHPPSRGFWVQVVNSIPIGRRREGLAEVSIVDLRGMGVPLTFIRRPRGWPIPPGDKHHAMTPDSDVREGY